MLHHTIIGRGGECQRMSVAVIRDVHGIGISVRERVLSFMQNHDALSAEFALRRSQSSIAQTAAEQPLHSIQYMRGGMQGMNGSDGPHFGVSSYHQQFHPFHPMPDPAQVRSANALQSDAILAW